MRNCLIEKTVTMAPSSVYIYTLQANLLFLTMTLARVAKMTLCKLYFCDVYVFKTLTFNIYVYDYNKLVETVALLQLLQCNSCSKHK